MRLWQVFTLGSLAFSCAVVPLKAQTIINLVEPQKEGCGQTYIVSSINGFQTSPWTGRGPSDKEIFKSNEKLAGEGNTDAAFQLGLAYLQGLGVRADLALAEHWFEAGAVKPGDKELVGSFYVRGYCFARDLRQAAHWLRAAGRPGDLFELAEAYRKSSPTQLQDAIPIYLQLLNMTGVPEVRRAQMELGNLVIDGKYSAGDDPAASGRNLQWARTITQELLGQEEYKIAVAYSAAVGVPKDDALWLRFCRRAAAYNIDLAQRFYADYLIKAPDHRSAFEGYAWMKLASEKQTGLSGAVRQMEQSMSPATLQQAQSYVEGLEATRARTGAYYPVGDPLRDPTPQALGAMPKNDPDAQLRRAFALEFREDNASYDEAMGLYRSVRDRREMDIRMLLANDYLKGTDGVKQDPTLAHHWMQIAAEAGSREAAAVLAGLPMEKVPEGGKSYTSVTPVSTLEPNTPSASYSAAAQPGPIVRHVGGAVAPPKFLRGPTPSFSKEARAAKISGRVQVYLLVDETGTPQHVRVVRGVGYGLDEKAVEAVRRYKFRPATMDGKPVTVDLYVEVKFQIVQNGDQAENPDDEKRDWK